MVTSPCRRTRLPNYHWLSQPNNTPTATLSLDELISSWNELTFKVKGIFDKVVKQNRENEEKIRQLEVKNEELEARVEELEDEVEMEREEVEK